MPGPGSIVQRGVACAACRPRCKVIGCNALTAHSELSIPTSVAVILQGLRVLAQNLLQPGSIARLGCGACASQEIYLLHALDCLGRSSVTLTDAIWVLPAVLHRPEARHGAQCLWDLLIRSCRHRPRDAGCRSKFELRKKKKCSIKTCADSSVPPRLQQPACPPWH